MTFNTKEYQRVYYQENKHKWKDNKSYRRKPVNIERKRMTDRTWYSKNKERILELKRNFRLNFPEQVLLYRTRSRAKSMGKDFNLTIDDIKIPTVCPIFETPIVYGDTDLCASIDRIDNSKGYIKGNIQIISNRANRIKNNASLQELKEIIKHMEKHK